MHLPISPVSTAGIVFAGAFAAVIFANQPASAQSPYSYPWCAKLYLKNGVTSCYYASRQVCMETVSGIGGYCYQNPAYRGAAASSPRYRRGRA
jgi:Protein of unknown function (DUF3551)